MDRTHTEELLRALLGRAENSDALVEELNFYISDLKNGELTDSDAKYIQALANRLGVVPLSSPVADLGAGEGSFLEHARAIARATMERNRPQGETDQETVLSFLSEQLDRLAVRLEENVLEDARGEGVSPVPTGQLRITLMRDSQTPAMIAAGNTSELQTTPGYGKLAAKCDEMELSLKLETGHRPGYEEQDESKTDSPGPALCHVDVVISGWV